jgi:hypothetical protein
MQKVTKEELYENKRRIERLVKQEYLGIDFKHIKHNPLVENRSKWDAENPLHHFLNIARQPDYHWLATKVIFNVNMVPFQGMIMKQLWTHAFPMLIGGRGSSKSWCLAVYLMLRMFFEQGSKVVVVGGAFRQAKTVFEYCETIWQNAPVLRHMCQGLFKQGPSRDVDRCTFRLGDSVAIFLPLGSGDKIRSARANVIIAEEFHVIPMDIYENVVQGFGATSMDPVNNVMNEAYKRVLQKMELWTLETATSFAKIEKSNQSIISGTAYYSFNHFCIYWKKYNAIIESRGDVNTLAQHGAEGLDYRDFVIIRLPAELLPTGFMDKKNIARSKATMEIGLYDMEYGAIFTGDSAGFFPRSLIERCIVKSHEENFFHAVIRGYHNGKYIMAVDPASEEDNFSIVILELHENHRRVVYCWTTNRTEHQERVKHKDTKEQDFYAFCARKIRDLMKIFPTEHIAMDAQGGGRRIAEALHDDDKMEPGEQLIWEILPDHPCSDGKERPSDDKHGLHILEMVEFARSEYVSEANHGLKKDMADGILLFPPIDAVEIALHTDTSQSYDTLESCTWEIVELVDELTTITHTQTPATKRDHWDTPEIKKAGGKKGRLRKDRYSALLMANMAARRFKYADEIVYQPVSGGFTRDIASRPNRNSNQQPGYIGPAWVINQSSVYAKFGVVSKTGV